MNQLSIHLGFSVTKFVEAPICVPEKTRLRNPECPPYNLRVHSTVLLYCNLICESYILAFEGSNGYSISVSRDKVFSRTPLFQPCDLNVFSCSMHNEVTTVCDVISQYHCHTSLILYTVAVIIYLLCGGLLSLQCLIAAVNCGPSGSAKDISCMGYRKVSVCGFVLVVLL